MVDYIVENEQYLVVILFDLLSMKLAWHPGIHDMAELD